MGRAEPGSVPPPALGNLELMKVLTYFTEYYRCVVEDKILFFTDS